MSIEAKLALPNYAGDLSQPGLPEYRVIGHTIVPPLPKDSAKRLLSTRVLLVILIPKTRSENIAVFSAIIFSLVLTAFVPLD